MYSLCTKLDEKQFHDSPSSQEEKSDTELVRNVVTIQYNIGRHSNGTVQVP